MLNKHAPNASARIPIYFVLIECTCYNTEVNKTLGVCLWQQI